MLRRGAEFSRGSGPPLTGHKPNRTLRSSSVCSGVTLSGSPDTWPSPTSITVQPPAAVAARSVVTKLHWRASTHFFTDEMKSEGRSLIMPSGVSG